MAKKGTSSRNEPSFLQRVGQYFRKENHQEAQTQQPTPTPTPQPAQTAQPNALQEAVAQAREQGVAVRGVEDVTLNDVRSQNLPYTQRVPAEAQRARGRSLGGERAPAPQPAAPEPSTGQTQSPPSVTATHAPMPAKGSPEMVDPKTVKLAADTIAARFDTEPNKGQSVKERHVETKEPERQPTREHDKDHDHDR